MLSADAAAFLEREQQPDGSWRAFTTLAGEGLGWPTAYCGFALAKAGRGGASLRRAVDLLLRDQGCNGGWGYHRGVPDDCDSTAFALLCLVENGGAPGAIEAGAARLESQQRSDGSFSTYSDAGPIRAFTGVPEAIGFEGWCGRHDDVTAACGRALAAAGREAAALKAWAFLERRQRADGSWPAYWWTTDLYATAQAVRLAEQLGGATGHAARDRARHWALSLQAADGSWPDGRRGGGSAFATALGLAVIDGMNAASAAAIAWLGGNRAAHGSWRAPPLLRIPQPWVTCPDERDGWSEDALGTGVALRDHAGCFIAATVLHGLA